jgi:hypothetical protein
MKQNNDIEQILLNDEKYEKFIKRKQEKEFKKILEIATKNESTIITDLKKMSKDKLFSKNATYFVINKNSKTSSYINGIQAESFLVSPAEREKFLSGKTDSFIYQDNYIKFYKYKG